MKDENISLNIPRKVGLGILGGVVVFALLGYILYFSAKGTASEKTKQFTDVSAKLAEMEQQCQKSKSDYDKLNEDFKQLGKDNETLMQQSQSCKTQLEEQSAHAGEIKQLYERCKNDLIDMQSKGGQTSAPSATITQPSMPEPAKSLESMPTTPTEPTKPDSNGLPSSHDTTHGTTTPETATKSTP